ncbi:DUF2066 domain-containing protein [Mesorhizobium sp.]|uniref:DUF2066 domain-containing protein n=1 Tax=Mesorhizobium sp. TaxID=1871066 RepID=UPI00121A27A2|nr:DUF2066 domain-containing protein [Mesorhizobium sp.]TIO10239.1 MAG: DUF2066 domain-containing protein [Mesorhizobium sp.]TIO36580.1 MAG: DUF2066 domain-containing protein [Mesorhizobium sp.]TIP13607.1 MAG: DUF2066 domain-containing protein [Mesorhizobium sp.]
MPGFLRPTLVAIGLMAACATARPALAGDDLYRAKTIVTGQGEENRRIGFKACLDAVLVRVSGDQRLPKRRAMAALRDKAGSFVADFRYRDRMEGIPIHDEQGTHDRPHDLTCLYRPDVIDKVLAGLGSKPWLSERPTLSVVLAVDDSRRYFVLASDGDENPYMVESLQSAAGPMAISIVVPNKATLAKAGLIFEEVRAISPELLGSVATSVGSRQVLAGSIVWSDKELGWIADWQLAKGGETYHWQVRGVSFDEAFRVAMRGAAQILSGNGQP